MGAKEKKQNLSTSEIASPSLPKMDLKKKKKEKVSKSQAITCPSFSKKDLVITNPSHSKMDLQEAMKKQSDVAMFLTGKVISAVARNSNFIFSPASINAVLIMVAASIEEETLRSFILSCLGSSSSDELYAVFREIASIIPVNGSTNDGGPKIAAAYGVWMEQSLSVKPSLKDLFENFFKAAFAQVDFRFKAEKVRVEVNAWASNHTNGLIEELLPPGFVKSDTACIYGNALYFKGTWQEKFQKDLTTNKEFHLLNDTSVSVPFMGSAEDQYIEAYDGFKVLQLPFRRGSDSDHSFSMYFYLPDKKDGLDNLVKKMTLTPGFVDNHIPRSDVKVGEFKIPKFRIEFGFEASKAFNEFELVDEIKISLYHKAWLEINEDGAEACASSKPYVRIKGCRWKPTIDFVADHPFLFLIKEDKTGIVLFAGQILDPSESSFALDRI
ncbi:unnamed protein product [Microthlaspi erraticum]|uniref:Serpin domain-containing protein n=1 Tax=Microthlaspi erraticum TaxID=1685480 RepID=A0A6D2I6V1_9BRAS|nr:unnamed protein product [Microthlaspi erraticum]